MVLVALVAALIVIDRRRPRRMPYPWLWLLPPGALIGVSLLFGVALYPGLPDEIPIHFDAYGVADHWVATTPFSVLLPVILQGLVTALLAVAAALGLRLAPRGDAAAAADTVRAILVLAAGLDLALLLVAQPVWRGGTELPVATMAAASAAAITGALAVGVTAVRLGAARAFHLGRPAGRALLAALIAVLLTAAVGAFAAAN